MFLKNIKLTKFRSFDYLNLSFDKNINIIVGDNALGKTNILESIYVLGLTKTFRYAKDKELIKNNEISFQISGEIERENFVDLLTLKYTTSGKNMFINNEKIKKVSDFISKLNVIIFSPDDLDLIKGPPDIRRKFINLEITQLFPEYYKLLNDYNNLLKIRNDYLKKMRLSEKVDMNYFSILEKYIIDKSIQIYKIRNKFLNKLSNKTNDLYLNTMGKSGFNLKYITTPHIDDFDDLNIRKILENSFSNNKQEEIKYGGTLFGPHKDDFEFLLEENNLKIIGSQSQQKIAVLVLKLAELELFKQQLDEYPILLLDDIFSELDEIRKNNILSYLKLNIQTIITTTDINNIKEDITKNANIINIKEKLN